MHHAKKKKRKRKRRKRHRQERRRRRRRPLHREQGRPYALVIKRKQIYP
jgi:hypothetical protein